MWIGQRNIYCGGSTKSTERILTFILSKAISPVGKFVLTRPSLTQATDTSNIRLVFAAVKDTILHNALAESGILWATSSPPMQYFFPQRATCHLHPPQNSLLCVVIILSMYKPADFALNRLYWKLLLKIKLSTPAILKTPIKSCIYNNTWIWSLSFSPPCGWTCQILSEARGFSHHP